MNEKLFWHFSSDVVQNRTFTTTAFLILVSQRKILTAFCLLYHDLFVFLSFNVSFVSKPIVILYPATYVTLTKQNEKKLVK